MWKFIDRHVEYMNIALGWDAGCWFIVHLVGVAAGRTGQGAVSAFPTAAPGRVDESPRQIDWSAAEMSFNAAHLIVVQAQTFTFR